MTIKQHHISHHAKLCMVIRCLREVKKTKAITVAKALGYTDESAYCKLESGQTNDISFWKLLIICQELHCSLFQLCYLADIDLLLGGSIKTWYDFDKSLESLPEEERKHLLNLAKYLRNQSLGEM